MKEIEVSTKAVVFKHDLEHGLNTLVLPCRAHVIHVEWQERVARTPDGSLQQWEYHNVLCLWTVQRSGVPATGVRQFLVVMTGEEFDVRRQEHIGSATSKAGIVAHVFEVQS